MAFDFVLPHTIHISEPMTPYIEPLSSETQLTSGANDYLHRIGSTLLQSMQLGYAAPQSTPLLPVATVNAGYVEAKAPANSLGAVDELQKQLQYDKFMNEVWIGIVLTLVIISLLFCICSCLLYHQFRKWKRNYRNTISQSISSDSDSDIETSKSKRSAFMDPVPEYALVSGLPSYESALELLQIDHMKLKPITTTNVINQVQQQQQPHLINDEQENVPLLTTTTTTATTTESNTIIEAEKEIFINNNNQQQQQTIPTTTTTTTTTVRCINEKVKMFNVKKEDSNTTTATTATPTTITTPITTTTQNVINNSHKKC